MNEDFKTMLLRVKSDYKVTQEQIAKAVGYDRAHISSVASGRIPLSPLLKEKLMTAYPNSFQQNTTPIQVNTTSEFDDIIDRLTEQISRLVEQNAKLIEQNAKLTEMLLKK